MKTQTKCRKCGSEHIKTSRRPLATLAGIVIVFAGSAIALPTLGFSLIVVIWGVFLTMPHHKCKDCGWMRKA